MFYLVLNTKSTSFIWGALTRMWRTWNVQNYDVQYFKGCNVLPGNDTRVHIGPGGYRRSDGPISLLLGSLYHAIIYRIIICRGIAKARECLVFYFCLSLAGLPASLLSVLSQISKRYKQLTPHIRFRNDTRYVDKTYLWISKQPFQSLVPPKDPINVRVIPTLCIYKWVFLLQYLLNITYINHNPPTKPKTASFATLFHTVVGTCIPILALIAINVNWNICIHAYTIFH